MKTFRFLAFQDSKIYYKGYLEIEANSEREAQEILKGKTQEDLESECFNWIRTDDANTDGDIDIDSASIHEIYE